MLCIGPMYIPHPRRLTRIPFHWALLVVAALANGCAPAPPLSQIEQQVFTRSCQFSSCHTPSGSPAGGLSLASGSFEKLVHVPSTLAPQKQRIVPFDADGSFLFEKLAQEKPSAGRRMPPGQPLPDDEIEMIRAWINAGAQNN